MRKELLKGAPQEAAPGRGLALTPIPTSQSRFNAALRNGFAVGLLVDAIPQEGVTGCGIQGIDN